jgi:hypothetical protein
MFLIFAAFARTGECGRLLEPQTPQNILGTPRSSARFVNIHFPEDAQHVTNLYLCLLFGSYQSYFMKHKSYPQTNKHYFTQKHT